MSIRTNKEKTVTFIYSVQITPNTREDVNFAFREAEIPAELIMDEGGSIFLTPVLSWSAWDHFPQSESEAGQIDPGWNEAVASGLKLMSDNGWLVAKPDGLEWREFKLSMRCSRMEAFQRTKDLPLLTSLAARR